LELGLTAEVPALWISSILRAKMNPIGRLQIDTKACKLLIIKHGGETGILYQVKPQLVVAMAIIE
jgi:hypothetical protein